ncbi:MAG: siphovirus Gp157 family protein [Spirochaetota bacterium]
MAAGAKAPAPGSQESSKVTSANFGRFTLYEIEDSVRKAIELFERVIDENGEIVDEKLEGQIVERLNQLNLAKELKATNVAVYIKSLWGQVSLLEQERIRLARREKSLSRKAVWLTKYLVSYLQLDPARPGMLVSGLRANIGWRRSDSLEVTNPMRLPLQFQKASITEVSEDELAKHGRFLKTLAGFRTDPRKDILKKRIKAGIAKGKKYTRIARLIEKYTIQIS